MYTGRRAPAAFPVHGPCLNYVSAIFCLVLYRVMWPLDRKSDFLWIPAPESPLDVDSHLASLLYNHCANVLFLQAEIFTKPEIDGLNTTSRSKQAMERQ